MASKKLDENSKEAIELVLEDIKAEISDEALSV